MHLVLRPMVKRSRSITPTLLKRAASDDAMKPLMNTGAHTIKKTRTDIDFLPNKIATAENAAKVDRNPPFVQLLQCMESTPKTAGIGESVVYWMRMEDMRRKLYQRYPQDYAEPSPLSAR